MPKEKLSSLLKSVLKFLRAGALPSEILKATSGFRAKLLTAFDLLVVFGRNFSQNRCPLRAAALSYVTILALVPLLAVAIGVSKTFLQASAPELVPKLLDKVVAYLAPQLDVMPMQPGEFGPPTPSEFRAAPRARTEAVENILSFIDNIHAGALGLWGMVFLILIAVRLLRTVERSFNDIWGAEKSRPWWRDMVYYWSIITLGPICLIAAIGFTGQTEVSKALGVLKQVPYAERLAMQALPFAVLWAGFALLYALMPNTRVQPRAALIGGIVAGTLWQLNNWLSVLYVSRVVAYSKIYGSLGIIPVFLIGLYFSWLIVLLGAQVSFTAQNFRVYLRKREAERVDQTGRELLACRIMLAISARFERGEPPLSMTELTERLQISVQLFNQIVHRLCAAQLVAEIASAHETRYQPARAPQLIRVADVLQVMRSIEEPTPLTVRGSDEAAVVGQLLHELRRAEENAPANMDFASLSARTARSAA
jgi:membrane protein